MSREDLRIIEQVSRILFQEKLITSEEQLRMLRLIRREGQNS